MKTTVKVIMKRPGIKAYFTDLPNTLEAMQHAVGGDIETINICTGLVICCNMDGKLKRFPYNCTMCEFDLVGSFFAVGVHNGKFVDVHMTLKEFNGMITRKRL